MANASVRGKFVQKHTQAQRKVKGCFPENANEEGDESEPPWPENSETAGKPPGARKRHNAPYWSHGTLTLLNTWSCTLVCLNCKTVSLYIFLNFLMAGWA